MKLFNYEWQGRTAIGFASGNEHVNLALLWGLVFGPHTIDHGFPATIDGLLKGGRLHPGAMSELNAAIVQLGASTLERIAIVPQARFLPPVLTPGKVLAVARNYRKHAQEMGSETPADLRWFSKLPSTIIPSGAPIVRPTWLEGEIHHEAELALVIGKSARAVSTDQAQLYIAGYSMLNDVTARTMQAEAKQARMPWDAAKNLDGFCPMGPYFVPAECVPDVQSLAIECRVNGEIRQRGSTSDMMHPVAKIVSDLSHHLTLYPGDVIATGTPEGVGKLEPGDLCECEAEGIGVLRNPIESAETPS